MTVFFSDSFLPHFSVIKYMKNFKEDLIKLFKTFSYFESVHTYCSTAPSLLSTARFHAGYQCFYCLNTHLYHFLNLINGISNTQLQRCVVKHCAVPSYKTRLQRQLHQKKQIQSLMCFSERGVSCIKHEFT